MVDTIEFCRGCQGRIDLPDGTQFYFCERLEAIARRLPGMQEWIVFTGIDEGRLVRMIEMGKQDGIKQIGAEDLAKWGRS